MMPYGAIHQHRIGSNLSSSCIISSYFWMTLAPSADSRHLRKDEILQPMQRLYSISFQWLIFQSLIFTRPLEQLIQSLIHVKCMTMCNYIFHSALVEAGEETHGWERCLNLEKGAWMRCCSSSAHLSPPATAGIFLLTGAEPEEVKWHYGQLHRCTVVCKVWTLLDK